MIRILIQAGHVAPRQKGHESETGTGHEQELSLKMQVALSERFFKDDRFSVALCPGQIPESWTGEVFIALHGDGASATSHGFSLGWPSNGRPNGRGPKLAALIARNFMRIPHPGGHHADNYTDGMRGYYGWNHTHAPTKVLIEHAFLTNPTERAWVMGHIDALADATFRAVLEHEGLPLVAKPAQAAPAPGNPRRIRSLDGLVTDWTGAFTDTDFLPALRAAIGKRGDVRVGNNK